MPKYDLNVQHKFAEHATRLYLSIKVVYVHNLGVVWWCHIAEQTRDILSTDISKWALKNEHLY